MPLAGRKQHHSSKRLTALSRRPQETASIVVLCDKFYSINCSADEVTSTGAHARAHREVAESTQPRALARRPKGVGRGGRRANRTHRPNPHSESQKFPVPAARAPCRRRASARPTNAARSAFGAVRGPRREWWELFMDVTMPRADGAGHLQLPLAEKKNPAGISGARTG